MQILQGKRVGIRPLDIADLDNLYQLENDPGNWDTTTTVNPISRFYLEQYIISAHNNIYQDKQLRLVITGENEETVGLIDLFDFDPHNRRAGTGIILLPEFRRRGYATEALDLLISFAHKTLNLKQLFCNIATDNTKSLQLFTSKGFEITGTKKAWRLKEHQWKDEHFLQLVF